MRALSAGSGADGPLPLFEPLALALAASPGLKLTGLQYREGSLFLSFTATDLQVLEGLRNWFSSRPGAALEVQSANAESGAVQIRARPYVLDVRVPYQEHVLPMIPRGLTVRDIITA